MFGIRYVARRDSDQPTGDVETFLGSEINDAIMRARSRVSRAGVSWTTGHPQPIGFLIFDATGDGPIYREYLS
jgi:hypothetical protein